MSLYKRSGGFHIDYSCFSFTIYPDPRLYERSPSETLDRTVSRRLGIRLRTSYPQPHVSM